MYIDAHAHIDRYGNDLKFVLDEIELLRILTIAVSMRSVLNTSAKSLDSYRKTDS